MYEMATRQVPFQGATSALIFVQLLNHAPEPLHDWNDSVPKELEKIILKLLSKEREARFQTATQLANALRKIPFRSGGGWLKRAAASVPLVRAADPVARAKRPLKPTTTSSNGAKGAPSPAAVALAGRSSSSGSTHIRPAVRTPQTDAGDRDEGVLRGDRSGSSALIPAATDNPVGQLRAMAATEAPSPRAEARVKEEAADPGKGVVADVRTSRKARLKVAPVERVEPVAEVEPEKSSDKTRIWIGAGALAVVMVGVFLLILSGRFRPVLLHQGDPVLLTVIQNRTSDKSLDGVVGEGLELMLDQGQYLTVLGGEAYRAGLRQAEAEGSTSGAVSGRRVAQEVGAKAYLYGEIKGSGDTYTISVDVLKTDSNDKLSSIVETANGKAEIAGAIDRVARRVRTTMGESDRTVAKSNVPLEEEATADIAALKAYSDAEGALQAGRIADAIAAYTTAVTIDPRFAQAHLRLAWLYRAERAEATAAAEAKLALNAAEKGSDRLKLLAQFCFEMNSSGDLERAAGVMRQFKELYPREVAGGVEMALVLRAQGELPESLQAAQQVYGEDPANAEAYREAEAAMIGMDRYQGVLQLDEQAAKLGVTTRGSTLLAAYLGDNAGALERETAAIHKTLAGPEPWQETYGQLADYGLSLDNDGRMTAGAAFWRTAATSAGGSAALIPAQGYLLAQAALDRALIKSCSQAAIFAADAQKLPLGMVANFDAGMATALCGDEADAQRAIATLQHDSPQSTAVNSYYVADLRAALALSANDAKGALTALASAAPYDQVSLTPYLRGLAHLETHEGSLAVADFQIILDHRGMAMLNGSDVYPAAQIGLARAYASLGDSMNSKAAYRKFAGLWQGADKGQALLDEAVAKSR